MDVHTGFLVPLDPPLERSLRWALERNFDHVELLLDGPYARERLPRESVVALLDETGLDLVVHLPFALDPGSPFAPVREGAVAELTAGLAVAADLGATKAVFHASTEAWDLGWDDDRLREYALDSTRRVARAARERGIEPCVENAGDLFTVRTFDRLLEAVDVAMTYDTGHARLTAPDEECAAFVEAYRDRISHVHLSDTRGDDDEHLPVGMGTVDFAGVLDALGDWSGTATHEVGTEDFATIAVGQRNFQELLDGR